MRFFIPLKFSNGVNGIRYNGMPVQIFWVQNTEILCSDYYHNSNGNIFSLLEKSSSLTRLFSFVLPYIRV